MADALDSRSKNIAFLKQLEEQRLKKTCKLVIDLRGKVAGECQAYSFGGLTHFLDDRAYILAKQLLVRFNGQYTVGVYEALIKAIKVLNQNTTITPQQATKQAVLNQDREHVQLIALDQQFKRKQSRIVHTTAVEIRLDDMRYNGVTLDIAPGAIRMSTRRVYTLEQNDVVSVTFPDISLPDEPSLPDDIPYKIVKITHDDRRSQIILVLDGTAKPEIEQWWATWVEQQHSFAHIDVEHQLLNLISDFYLRIASQNTQKPLLWLSHLNDQNPIKVINQSKSAEKVFSPLYKRSGHIDFSLLPLSQAINSDERQYLALIYADENISQSQFIAYDDKDNIRQALHIIDQHPTRLFLVETQQQEIDIDYFKTDFEGLPENSSTEIFRQKLAAISNLVTISDITESCQQLNGKVDKQVEIQATVNTDPVLGDLPKPSILSQSITRKSPRFLIKTDVLVHLVDQRFTIRSNNISETGMSVTLPGNIDVKVGTPIRVNFVRWQNQTKKFKLDAVPFLIRNRQYWQGETSLGLERNIFSCGEKVNTFFSNAIEQNKEQLAIDNNDQLINLSSKILGFQLPSSLSSIPFFLAKAQSSTYLVQAVATTQKNNASEDEALWQMLNQQAKAMSEILNNAPDDAFSSANFALYCYLDSTNNWIIHNSHDFTSPLQKSLFINRALLAKQQRFFHCSLSAIKSNTFRQESDLDEQLSIFRRHTPNTVRQIRETIQSLFAVGELTDITTIISNGLQQKTH